MTTSQRRLRVLSISHSAVNASSGRTRYEAVAKLRADIDLTLVAPARWREYGKPMKLDPHVGDLDFRVEPIRLPYVPKVGWYLHYYPTMARLIRQIKPDVLHLWEEPWSLVGLQGILLRDRLCSQAAVVLETEQNIFRRLPMPFEQIRRYTLRRTDLLIARQLESLEVARACGYRGLSAVLDYGVAPGVFARQDRAKARAKLGVGGFVIGYVGRVVPEKGLHDMLEAMMAVPDLTFVILGAGPEVDTLQAHAQRLQLGDRLVMLSPRAPAEVARVMNALDALVLLSHTTRTWKEQFGRVIMEAQACGIPVIGSDSGSIPNVVGPGGWIVPEGNVSALAALLAHLASAPEEVARAGAAGYEQAQTRYSVAKVANDLADAYQDAAAARRAFFSPSNALPGATTSPPAAPSGT